MHLASVHLAGLLMTANLAQVDPVFDLPAILKPPLESQVLKRSEKDGIVLEEVKFHSHMDGAKRIDIFALFAYPRGAKKAPAFVWNQGGLYQATPYWPEFGAKRGYATLCIDFPIPGYRSTGGFPINSDVLLPDNPRAAPIYHGAVALLRAVSFLQSHRSRRGANRHGRQFMGRVLYDLDGWARSATQSRFVDVRRRKHAPGQRLVGRPRPQSQTR